MSGTDNVIGCAAYPHSDANRYIHWNLVLH
jgi:hypothetical protein